MRLWSEADLVFYRSLTELAFCQSATEGVRGRSYGACEDKVIFQVGMEVGGEPLYQ